MSELLRTIAAYVPPNITRATLQDQAPTPPSAAVAERFPAVVLFADVSGFTPLTEALAQKGLEGPEELTRLLNGYFSRMIDLIEAEGGDVVKFSGDALTVVFPAVSESLAIATRRAAQAAEAMQVAMTEFATLNTSVGPVALGMKIGIGAGEVLAMRVGGVQDHWEYVIAGDPLRQVAEAEHQAQRGDIILSPEAEMALLISEPVPSCPLSQPDWSQIQNPAAVEAVLRVYVPGVVAAWLKEELQAWLAVLRPMSVLFVGVGGIDYSQASAVETLHTFLGQAQAIISRYEGSINKLAVDDKGTVLIALFGAPPHAHEDDSERALRCALAWQALAEAQGLQLAIGVTTGRVFTGPVGGETRREYTVMGDTVNLAARLMTTAGLGQILCDYETYRWARSRLAFDILPSVRVKGKAGLIRVYRPVGEVDQADKAETTGILVGRQAEVARLNAALEQVQTNGGTHCLLIEGEAGIGKSRLIEELVRLMRERGLTGLLGRGHSIEQQTPYRAWRDIFSSYFGLDKIDDPSQRERLVEEQARDVVPDQIERLPLLNDILSLGLPENTLTTSLDSQLRHNSLTNLLLTLLRVWATERPLVLVLEDAHWLDSLSWDLTLQVVRALSIARVPMLLVMVMRPLEGEAMRIEPMLLARLEETETLSLESLSPEETLTLAAARLGLGDGKLPPAVAELVRTRAGGNPFFAEELVYALRDSDLIRIETEAGETRCLIQGDLARAAQALPDTIQGIVLSRIDRLPPEEQLALKVAAVIGRTFGYTPLRDTLGEHMEISERHLRTYLDDLAHLSLTPLDAQEPELTYIFKHIIIQEVAYETLLFAQRRQLHRSVARWYEQTLGDGTDQPAMGLESPLAPYYPLLVYHWHRAEDRDQERHYASLAGQWAAAQFANVEAVGYLSRALTLTSPADLVARYSLLLVREAVNDLRGEREAQAQDLTALAELGEQMGDDRRGAEVALRLANYDEVISDYAAALVAIQQAVEQAARAQNVIREAEAYIAWGKILWRQGDYEAARSPLTHALTLARASDNRYSEAKSLYYLGHVYLYQGNYPDAQDHYRQALEIYRASGHRQEEGDCLSILGVTYYELGDYALARDHYERVLAIFQTIGDRRGETMTLNNLGTVYCDLGDYALARDYHQRALELRLTIADHWGQANSLVNLGLVYHGLEDDVAARQHCERALTIQQEIGDRHGEGYSLTYLGHALAGLEQWSAAIAAYAKAMHLRRELGQHSLAIDDLAGLARVALGQNNLEQAVVQAEEILAWIAANGVVGIEYPLQVYLTCYRVLGATTNGRTAPPDRADAILSQAHDALLKQASGISDDTLRWKFLENVKTNREIIAAWASRSASGV